MAARGLPFPLLQASRVGRATRGVEELDTATSSALDSACGVAVPLGGQRSVAAYVRRAKW